ncbi:uncharacterized protein LOC118478446 [Aplysia californica]|uniref:Uncharacterized protein LOC118478446 n=1 Tax=Aplysia californica TaxID=6500 RepID=A0ABM1VZV4_APLCA|nr:uncharacterized protein LOC118478446 [Aplysia californica]
MDEKPESAANAVKAITVLQNVIIMQEPGRSVLRHIEDDVAVSVSPQWAGGPRRVLSRDVQISTSILTSTVWPGGVMGNVVKVSSPWLCRDSKPSMSRQHPSSCRRYVSARCAHNPDTYLGRRATNPREWQQSVPPDYWHYVVQLTTKNWLVLGILL